MRNLVKFVQKELRKCANPEDVPAMQAYVKTDMPFYGVRSAPRTAILREVKKKFPAVSVEDYQQNIQDLWSLPHREEKFLAIGYARAFPRLISSESLPVYEAMIREGQWWDFVDDIAVNLVGAALKKEMDDLMPVMDRWIFDDDMWIRRAAILSQLKFKDATDSDRLFRYCSTCMAEKEFFIRKAIGWVLREYSKTDAVAVRKFIRKNEKKLSGLSVREGMKHLNRR